MQHHPTTRPTLRSIARAALVALTIALVFGGSVASSDRAAGQVASQPVEINSATAEQLETIPGIGPATAARIIAFRKEHGPFRRVEDLIKVRGIGETTFQKIRRHIRVARED